MIRRAALLACAFVPRAAEARVEAHPYIEVQQVFSADLSGGGDAVTYTGVGAGIDVSVTGRRFTGQLDYRYDHFFAWSHRYRDSDTHTGLASADYQLGSGFSLDGAGIAARTRGSLAQATPGLFAGDFANTQQVYALEAGPSFAHRVGPFAVTGDYRFGWTKTQSGYGTIDLGPGQPRLDNDFTATSHTVDGSVGIPYSEGMLPFGWTVSGGYTRDNVHFLDAHYDGAFVQGEVTVPVSPTLALVGGVGYEWNAASEAPIRTDADGNAVLTSRRRLQADRTKPRLLVYDQDGLIWDVGVLWRPNPRLQAAVRVGRRYGGTSVTGSLTWQAGRTETVQVVAYDDVSSFGRQLTGGIGTLPTSFSAPDGTIPIGIGGCVFGADGGAGTCLPALSSANANFYHSRGVYALATMVRGPWTFGLGANYDHRHYLAPDYGRATVLDYAGVDDDSVTVNGIVSRRLGPRSTVSGAAYVGWYRTDLLNSGSRTIYGATGAFTRLLTRRLVGQASISVYSGAGNLVEEDVIGTGIVALRYQL